MFGAVFRPAINSRISVSQPPYLSAFSLLRFRQEHCNQLCSPQHRQERDLMEQVQRRVTMMMRELECFCYEDWLRVFSLEKEVSGET